MEAIVTAITGCRLEKTDPVSEDAVMMKILQVLAGTMHHRTSILLSDPAVCMLLSAANTLELFMTGASSLLLPPPTNFNLKLSSDGPETTAFQQLQ
ncbi:hypothetical protein HN873_053327 [Arachis hypogaea]